MVGGYQSTIKWLVILACLLLNMPAFGARWGQVDLSIGDPIYDVFFLDQDRGFLVGANGLVRYTLNGGDAPGDWLMPDSNPTVENLYKVFFVDPLNGFAVGGNGTLLTTSNGGVDWDDTDSLPTAQNLTSVFFEDQSMGWITSFQLGQPLWQTSSGTANLQLRFGLDGKGRDVLFHMNDGWLVVNDTIFPGLVYESDDHGQNWFQTGPISGSTEYYAVTRNGLGEVWVVGQNGTMIRGPSPWQSPNQPVAASLRDIAFSAGSPNYGWAVGDSGTLLGTDDAGDTWVEASTVVAEHLHAVAVYEQDRAWAVGDGGNYLIYRECIDDTDCTGTLTGCVDFSACDQTQHVCGVVLPDASLCDDGLYCTVDETCQLGACVGVAKDCSSFADQCNQGLCDEDLDSCYEQPINEGLGCDDGLFCTAVDTCVAGSCSGQTKDCSGFSDQCNQGECDDELDSCYAQPINEGLGCDDGLYCTLNDTCQAGSCDAQVRDCSGFSDQCNQGLCDEVQDSCYAQPINEGLVCNDDLYCTVNDTCNVGICSGPLRDCSAFDDACNLGQCFESVDSCQAVAKADGLECDDQSLCTEQESCQQGVCTGTAVDCSDDNICTNDSCDPVSGCVYTPNTLGCDDADQCTMQDVCVSGVCQGVPLDQDGDGFVADNCGGDDCDDSRAEVNPGVFESAFGQAACLDGLDNDCDTLIDQSDPGCAQCEVDQDCLDQNVCNGLEKCVDQVCMPAEALQCDDQNECTQDECDPQMGCSYTELSNTDCAGYLCEDLRLLHSTCVAGNCVGSRLVEDCDDQIECSLDTCDVIGVRCQHDPNRRALR